MSSPMINNVVILGCFFCYVFVFLLGIDSRFVDDHVFGTLCNVSGLSLYHLRKYSRIVFRWKEYKNILLNSDTVRIITRTLT